LWLSKKGKQIQYEKIYHEHRSVGHEQESRMDKSIRHLQLVRGRDTLALASIDTKGEIIVSRSDESVYGAYLARLELAVASLVALKWRESVGAIASMFVFVLDTLASMEAHVFAFSTDFCFNFALQTCEASGADAMFKVSVE
jgi:uncharacterized membrane protein